MLHLSSRVWKNRQGRRIDALVRCEIDKGSFISIDNTRYTIYHTRKMDRYDVGTIVSKHLKGNLVPILRKGDR